MADARRRRHDTSSRPAPFDAISLDLPWSRATNGRTAVAAASARDGIVVSDGLDGPSAANWIADHAAPGAVVLLDVPVDGCEGLSQTRPRRAVDDGLARIGIPILPSYKSGDVGPFLREALHRGRPDLRVHETYPYAVLRVLWALREETGAVDLRPASYEAHADRWPAWSRWPPRYKRARTRAERCLEMGRVAKLIRSCGEPYASLVRTPRSGTSAELARLSDEYDAVLGLLAARALADGSPWSWRAEAADGQGSIVTIGPRWIRSCFREAADQNAPVRTTCPPLYRRLPPSSFERMSRS
jgi:hypothetical protein